MAGKIEPRAPSSKFQVAEQGRESKFEKLNERGPALNVSGGPWAVLAEQLAGGIVGVNIRAHGIHQVGQPVQRIILHRQVRADGVIYVGQDFPMR